MTLVTEVSRKATLSREATTITRVLHVYPYADYPTVVNLILGGVSWNGVTLQRILPLRDVYHPWAIATEVDVEGEGAFGTVIPSGVAVLKQANGYSSHAVLTVKYSTPESTESDSPDKPEEQDLATQSWELTSQSLTHPTNFFKWKYSPQILSNVRVPVTTVFPQITQSLTRHFVPRIPWKALSALTGRVNRNPMKLGGITWPVECVRFDGASVSQKISNRGVKLYELTYKFALDPRRGLYAYQSETLNVKGSHATAVVKCKTRLGFIGHNRIFRPDRAFYDRVTYNAIIPDADQFDDPDQGISSYTEEVSPSMYLGDRPDASGNGGYWQILQGKRVYGFDLLFHPFAY